MDVPYVLFIWSTGLLMGLGLLKILSLVGL
jgi:hypothetical protein